MNLELKTILLTVVIGGFCAPILLRVFKKMNVGKKETREEVEERNFGTNR